MSLTSKITGKTDADKAFRNLLTAIEPSKDDYYTLSEKNPFSSEYELLAPSVVQQQTDTGLVGTAFDYLARLRVAQFMKREDVLQGMVWMNAYINLVETTSLTYDAGENWITQLKSFIKKKGAPITDVLEISVHMAKFEQIYRSGKQKEGLNIDYLLQPASKEVITDLSQLIEVFEKTFMVPDIIQKKSKVIFNPNFGVVSELMGGADGDIYIDGTLYDFKTGKKNLLSRNENLQMVGYYLLGLFDSILGASNYGFHESGMNIKRVAFYRARFGEIEYCDLQKQLPYKVMKPTISAMGELLKDKEVQLQLPPYSDKENLRKQLK